VISCYTLDCVLQKPTVIFRSLNHLVSSVSTIGEID